MTPQVKGIVFVIIVVGINITNGKKPQRSEEIVKIKSFSYDTVENSTTNKGSFESVKTLESKENDERRQLERKQQKRENRNVGLLYPQTRKKPKLKQTVLDNPYLKEAPYPKDAYLPEMSLYSEQENNYRQGLNKPQIISDTTSMPLVATDIDIRRAVPFENDFISRHYAFKFHYPPAMLSPDVSNINPKMLPVPLNSHKSNDYSNENINLLPYLSLLKMYPHLAQRLRAHNYPSPPSLLPTTSFLPNAADELNRFRNQFVIPQVEPTRTFVSTAPVDYDYNRATESAGFVPWTPPGYEQFQQFTPLDRFTPGVFAPAQPPSTGFNVEVSEIGEPAFIVPENVGKVDIIIPPPFAALRTHALSINDAQITRNEVRKDNGEFVSSYTTSEGTERLDSGALVPTRDGDQVLVTRGSYSFTSPEGLRFRVDYTADETGYHATQVPVSGGAGSS